MQVAPATCCDPSSAQQALAEVQATCDRRGLRLTPTRRKVLEFLLAEPKALGAYAILELLEQAGYGAQPPVAYRALDFLTTHGFAHRIERLNAFVACAHPGEHHAPAFMVCRACLLVVEAHATAANGPLGPVAEDRGFAIERTVVEAIGLCAACSADVHS